MLLAVLTVIATIGQLPSAAAETGGAGEVEEAGENVPVTGLYGKLTDAAVRSFQAARGVPADGAIGTGTWESLLNFTPYRMRWSGSRARVRGGSSGSRVKPPSRPLPAQAYEINPGPAP